ncbi:HAD family hydrolase [Anoxybacter fermentans]|uniref:HAD family hydrolase n=1 Tax=Anoxybacter fermentans TaxID=1323375 RepID=A0A3Q9HS55_9FIRM|nr:HAD family phosphatase [Anoxybacter fermentans]AZR73249.1 HAD family hydrolase [Anoxybacter fermentans]
MIHNIIFDLGNVLLNFKPLEYLTQKVSDLELVNDLYQQIFCSEEWVMLDRGVITIEEAIKRICLRNPEKVKLIEEILYDWEKILTPIEGSVEILRQLKEKNFNLYVLSNFHLRAFEKVSTENEFFQLFDGMIISAKVRYLKPEPEIYQYLIEHFKIDPERTIFIDDTRENLDAAKKFGIKTIHFISSSDLCQELKKLKVL